jgi:hypothetical protein
MQYTVQKVEVTSSATSITFKLADYSTPDTASDALLSSSVTCKWDSSAVDVQSAIETISNVEAVDVEKTYTDDASASTFLVTFLSNLGEVPLMSTGHSDVAISLEQNGVTEVQTITVAGSVDITLEEQLISVASGTTEIKFVWNGNAEVTVNGPGGSGAVTEDDLKDALETLNADNGSILDVSVTSEADSTHTTFRVVFTNPVGDIPTIDVTSPSTAIVSESVKGVTPVTGSFTVFYEGEYTDDIPMDASASTVKSRLEALSTIGTLDVSRDFTVNGFKWTVSFIQNVGNLRMMEASPYRYEIQFVGMSN